MDGSPEGKGKGRKGKDLGKLLGQEVVQVFDLAFQSKDGTLGVDEYLHLWQSCASGSKDTAQYLEKLVCLLMDVLENRRTLAYAYGELVNSIVFISLFVDLPKLPNIQKVLTENWQPGKHKYNVSSAVEDVMRSVYKILVEKEVSPENINAIIDTLMIQCYQLHNPEEYSKMSNIIKYPTFKDSERGSAEFCFLYHYLATKMKPTQLIRSALLKCRTIPQQMKVNQKLSETALLALCHVLRKFISLAPLTDPALIKLGFASLEPFYLWPEPFCSVVRDLLLTFRAEQFAPGSAMRASLHQECYLRLLKNEEGRLHTPFYHVFDASSAEASTLAELMHMELESDRKKVEAALLANPVQCPFPASGQLATETEIALLVSAFEVDVSPEAADASRQVIGNLSDKQIHKYCADMEALMQTVKSDYTDPAKATEARKKGMQAIHQQLLNTAKALPTPREGKQWVFPVPESGIMPSHLPVMHLSMPAPVNVRIPTKNEALRYPVSPHNDQLFNLLYQHAQAASLDCPSELRLGIMGGDRLVHSLLCALVSIQTIRPDFFKSVRLKLYLIPLQASKLACFIARHDPWYNRHVFIPFRAPFMMVPKCRYTADFTFCKRPNTSLSLPGEKFRELLHIYAREAQHTLPVKVFQVEASAAEDQLGGPMSGKSTLSRTQQISVFACEQRIPFISRMEIGVAAAARAYAINAQLPESTPLEDILKDRNFVYTPVELKVTYTRVGMDGKPIGQQQQLDDKLTYQQLVLANIPVPDDPCLSSNPSVSYLELYAQVSDKIKVKGKRPDKRVHVSTVEVSCAETDRFWLMADGNVFGPYRRVRVSRLVIGDGEGAPTNGKEDGQEEEQLSFPVQTFFPIDLASL